MIAYDDDDMWIQIISRRQLPLYYYKKTTAAVRVVEHSVVSRGVFSLVDGEVDTIPQEGGHPYFRMQVCC